MNASSVVSRGSTPAVPSGRFDSRTVRRLLVLTGIGLFLLASSGAGWLLGGAALAAGLALVVWQWPYLGLWSLIVVGTFHAFIMLLVFHFTGSTTGLKLAQIWKEMVLLVLLAKALGQAFRARQAPKLYLLDLGIVFFIGCGLLYLVIPSTVPDSTIISKGFGLRADAFFLVAYFVGRGISVRLHQVRALLIAFCACALVVASVAVVQFMAPGVTNLVFEMLGFSEFMQVQRGDQIVQLAIRQNVVAGLSIPRASSLFLSDLALAFYTLLAVPLVAAFFFTLRGLRARLVANLILLGGLATALTTVTRSAILALMPSLAAVTLRSRKLVLGVVVVVQAVTAGSVIAYGVGLKPDVLAAMFSPGEGSIQGHLASMQQSFDVLRVEPLGRGLGTAGQVAQRFVAQGGITNESWYLQIATEIGLIPAVVFELMLIALAVMAFQRSALLNDDWLRGLCLGMGGATIAFGLVGMTLHVWEGLTTSIIFWLLAGFVIRAPDLAQDEG